MNTIITYGLYANFFISMAFMILMPMWIALAVRLIFRRTTKRRVLAVLTALPFTAWLSIKSGMDIIPILEWHKYGTMVRVITIAPAVFGILLIGYGIPYLLAKAGVAIGDKIMKRNPSYRVEPTADADAHL